MGSNDSEDENIVCGVSPGHTISPDGVDKDGNLILRCTCGNTFSN